MVQSEIIQIDVAFLTYNPKLCADTPSVKQDSACLAAMSDLKRHRDHKRKDKATMGVEAYRHYKWYNSMLCHEINVASENSKLNIIHWHVESGNKEAFMMGGVLYKAVSIIIGADMEHWYCANTGKDGTYSHGSRYRKNEAMHEQNTMKMACFTIDDNEATLVFQPDSLSKCTSEVCANNCMECKKFRSPFTKTNTISQCVCFPSRDDFKSIDESDLEVDSDSEDPDIAHLPSTFAGRRGNFNRFTLNAIREESIVQEKSVAEA